MTHDGEAPYGPNITGLHKFRHKETDLWRCRVCHYWPNIDTQSKFCVSCGRDYWGNPGTIPTDVGDARQQVNKIGVALDPNEDYIDDADYAP